MSKRSSQERGTEIHSLDNVLRTERPRTTVCSVVRRTFLFSEKNLFPRACSRVLAAVTAGLLLTALPVSAKVPAKVAPVETAVIENTGSTNTIGYQILVSSDGKVTSVTKQYDVNNEPAGINVSAGYISVKEKPIAAQDASKLFHDLRAAMPLTALPVRHGMRSASFGTQTFITYRGQRSPDLTFAADSRTSALKIDVEAITRWLGVGNLPRHPMSRKAL